MEISDIMTTIISGLALIISIISGIFSYKQNYIINQYEFASKEKTKEDVLQLLAALQLIIDKAIYNHLLEVNLTKEKEVIKDFLLTDTWTTIRYIRRDDEYIRMITVRFLLLLSDENVVRAGKMALYLEKDISKICEYNLEDILKAKRELKQNLNRFNLGNESDFNKEWFEKRFKDEDHRDQEICNRLIYLKNEKGIQDYNIDMWIGLLKGDGDMLKNALQNGANAKADIVELLEKYKDYK